MRPAPGGPGLAPTTASVEAALALPLPVLVVGLDGRCVGASADHALLTGRDATGADWLEGVHPDDRASAEEAWRLRERAGLRMLLRTAVSGGAHRRTAVRGRRLDDRHWLLVVLDDDEGATTRAMLESVLQRAPVGMSFVDPDLRYVRMNDRLATIDGQQPDQVAGRRVADVVPDLWPQLEPLFRRVLAGEVVEDVEVSGETAAAPGRQRHWRASYFPVCDEADHVIGVGSVVQEETERYEAEERLTWLASVVQSSQDLIAVVEPDGRLRYLNSAGMELLGVDPARVADLRLDDVTVPNGALDAQRAAAMRRQGWWRGLTWVQPLDGGLPIPVDTSTWHLPAPRSGGEPAVVVVQRDARARLAAEQRLAAAAEHRTRLLERVAVAAEEERRRVSEDIHDDSLQALAAADLRLGMLRKRMTSAGEPELEALERVRTALVDATERLRDLVFRLEPPGRHQPLVEGLRSVLEPVVEGTGIELDVRGGRVADLREGPRTAVYRVVREAVHNVLKHAEASHVEVVVEVGEGAGGRRLQVRVDDDGRGILSGDATRPGHLGLVAMQERAAIVGGSLAIRARDEGGTRVLLEVPLEPVRR